MSNRTKKHIKKTLLDLMKHNNYHELTISEICASGDLARRSFCNHYKTKEDVVADIDISSSLDSTRKNMQNRNDVLNHFFLW